MMEISTGMMEICLLYTSQNGKLCITPRGQFAYNLPIAEDEYLVLTPGKDSYNWLGGDMVLAFDSSGEEILRLPGYGLSLIHIFLVDVCNSSCTSDLL